MRECIRKEGERRQDIEIAGRGKWGVKEYGRQEKDR